MGLRESLSYRPSFVRPGGAIASSGPADNRNYQLALSGAGLLPRAASIPIGLQRPIALQQHLDCGPEAKASMDWMELGLESSPRFSYYYARQLCNTLPADTGTTAMSVMTTGSKRGACHLTKWSYEGDINQAPSQLADIDASGETSMYFQCSTIEQVQQAITSNHLVFAHWYATKEWYSPSLGRDGQMEVKTPNSFSIGIGGHFTVIDAFNLDRPNLDLTSGSFRVANSWSTSWGLAGRSWLSIDGWFNRRGDASSRFTILAKAPSPVLTTLKMTVSFTQIAGTLSWTTTNSSSVMLNGVSKPLNGSMSYDGSPKYDLVVCDLNGRLPTDGSGWKTLYPLL